MKNTQIFAEDIKSQPVNLHFGRGQICKVTPVANTGDAIAGTHFELELMSPTESDPDAKKNLYIFNGADPGLAGKTGVEYTLVGEETPSAVAAAIQTGVENAELPEVREVWVKDGEVYIWSLFFGKSAGAVDGASATGFTFANTQEGRGGFLGSTQDGVEFTPEIESEDILVDQAGSAPVASLFKGVAIQAVTSLMELTPERMAQIYGTTVGESFEPEEGVSVVGFGTAKIGQNMVQFADELVMHPVANAWNEWDDNIHLFKAAILPGGLNFGSEVTKAQVTFTAYVDNTKDKRANLACYGNGFAKGLRA